MKTFLLFILIFIGQECKGEFSLILLLLFFIGYFKIMLTRAVVS